LYILILLAAGLVLLAIAGILYQRMGVARDLRRFPAPGRLVDIGRGRRHLIDSGTGSPAVIFEAGIASSCLNWTSLRAMTEEFARTVTYDRGGLGWSDAATAPRVLSQLIVELHQLLAAAGVPAPYILVGHSFGGMLSCAYAVEHADQVAGLVLIDPLTPSDWSPVSQSQIDLLRRGIRLSRRGAFLSRLGVVRASLQLAVRGARRIPKLVAKASSGQGESTLTRLIGEVQKMPPEIRPIVQANWCQPKSFLGMAGYFESMPASAAEAVALGAPAEIPVTIFSAGTATAAQLAEREAIVRRSPRGKHLSEKHWGHWIHLDETELVAREIREMLEWTRQS